MNSELIHRITLDEIEVYIRDRKVSELQKLFPQDRQRRTIWYMFYRYSSRGWKSKAQEEMQEEIVLKTDEYLVIRSRSYKEENYQKELYHAVNVIGIENNVPWIHTLPWRRSFEDDDYKWTLNPLKAMMHFDESISDKGIQFEER